MPVRIEVEKARYLPGEVIRGQLVVELAKPTRARKVELTFKGREHAVVTRGSGDSRRVYVQDVEIANFVLTPWVPTGDEPLGPCQLSFPFQFQLPPNALPTLVPPLRYSLPAYAPDGKIRKSIPSKFTGTITYEIRAKVDKPHALDPKAKWDILVVPPQIAAGPMPRKPLARNVKTPDFSVHIHVDKGTIKPGDYVTGVVKYTQTPGINVRAVEVSTQFTLSITARGTRDQFTQIMDRVQFAVDPAAEFYEWPFDLATFHDGPFSVLGTIVRIIWTVTAKVDIARGKDKHVEVAIDALPLT